MGSPELIESIAYRSSFEHLYLSGKQYDGRYATVYEALIGGGGRQNDIAVRVFDLPESDRAQFQSKLQKYIDDWSTVSDDDRLVSVLDWGVEPRPWIATPSVSNRLSKRSPMEFVDLLSTAKLLVDGIAQLHHNDMTHAGLDPQSVVFVGQDDGGIVTEEPLLDNPGLLHLYRYGFDPTEYLDPRYAAPEHYSEEFGKVDSKTDIYLLGAVLYRLFSGEAPFQGSLEQVRMSVLNQEPPTPTDRGVSPLLDTVISKAMAKQKLHRYETIEHLQQDMANIAATQEYE